MYIDLALCIDCGSCADLAPGMRERPDRVAVRAETLEAMAACPVGAILWLEGEGRESHA